MLIYLDTILVRVSRNDGLPHVDHIMARRIFTPPARTLFAIPPRLRKRLAKRLDCDQDALVYTNLIEPDLEWWMLDTDLVCEPKDDSLYTLKNRMRHMHLVRPLLVPKE